MEWQDVPNSDLFKQIKAGKLPHPTSAAFDRRPWVDALEKIEDRSPRDYQLAVSAVQFGKELQNLRASMTGHMVGGLTRDRALRLLAALANQQHVTMIHELSNRLKDQKKASEPLHLELTAQTLFSNAAGQAMTADDATATLVDSLPHWLFHIARIDDEADGALPDEIASYGMRAMVMASIEHSLRSLWQGALWLGDEIGKERDQLVQKPGDGDLAKLWLIWDLRTASLQSWEHAVDLGSSIVTGGKLSAVDPVSRRTVTKIARWADGSRRYVIGNAKGSKAEQRTHVSERDMLDRLHVGLFLDEPLPLADYGGITCRDLNAAWWVLEDIARLLRSGLSVSDLPNDRAIGQFALTASLGELAGVLVDSLGMSVDRAQIILGILTCDLSNTSQLFREGLWTKPLLPSADGDRCYIILAPLIVGSPVRRVEAWMAEGGISDNANLKGRGAPYEAFVRCSLDEQVSANPLIQDYTVHPHGLKRKGSSEQIDLLIRIGRTIIIGEVKCLTSPSEPLERANYLANLDDAASQARTKMDWVLDNQSDVRAQLLLDENPDLNAFTFIPLVVTAQSFGIGLSRYDVPIVDYHFLSLLLSSGEYQGDTKYERNAGVISNPVTLYLDQADLESRIADLLSNPPPLRRYHRAIGWRRMPFPLSSGSNLMIELPELISSPVEPINSALLNQLPAMNT